MVKHTLRNFGIIAVIMLLISIGLSLSSKKQTTILGFMVYQAMGYSPISIGLHLLLTLIAFLLALFVAASTLNSARRLLEGKFKKYVLWTSMGKMSLVLFLGAFFTLEVGVFYYSPSRFVLQTLDTFGLLALIAAMLFFIKSSTNLDVITKVIGFKRK